MVYNVAPNAVGIIVHKVVGNRYLEKRVNIRLEHVRHSKCRDDFLRRVKENAAAKKNAKSTGERVNVKRQPAAPRTARTIQISKDNAVETLRPIAYDTVSSFDVCDFFLTAPAYTPFAPVIYSTFKYFWVFTLLLLQSSLFCSQCFGFRQLSNEAQFSLLFALLKDHHNACLHLPVEDDS
jgi:hypothetical protein